MTTKNLDYLYFAVKKKFPDLLTAIELNASTGRNYLFVELSNGDELYVYYVRPDTFEYIPSVTDDTANYTSKTSKEVLEYIESVE